MSMSDIWELEHERRNREAARHDAGMIGKMRCGRCGHTGLVYDSDRVGGALIVWAVCPKCGARREL